ncbi:LysR family transcriptional regulator [Vibrio hannami]|uniref:LysR family transcriptional regulator n=1 Tax=Vibrio hannami TaxID=2717094 RepID=UPI002410597E|nr:LysR family transcriptional regulator [Vibrio hannami]MDG3084952.1 LysR family transcriptional regulator [Vibrio hannami]
MELRQLKYFLSVAEQGSISAASRKLNLAQPAISSAIKKLETELETALFYRQERGVSLTIAGEEFLVHARQILKQTADAQLSMKNLSGLDTGVVEIGVPSMIGSYYFPPILMAFKHQYPGLQLNVIDDGTHNIQQMLLNDEIELGVIADQYLTPELDSGTLVKEEMVVCMAADHPLAQKERIEYKDFLAHELVLFRKGYYHHSLINRISREEKLSPKIAFSSNLLPLIKSIIRQGYGISPMWKVAIQDDDSIVTRRFSKPFYIELSLAWKKDRFLSSANQAFRDFVLANVGS